MTSLISTVTDRNWAARVQFSAQYHINRCSEQATKRRNRYTKHNGTKPHKITTAKVSKQREQRQRTQYTIDPKDKKPVEKMKPFYTMSVTKEENNMSNPTLLLPPLS